jgi:hypothetical protein
MSNRQARLEAAQRRTDRLEREDSCQRLKYVVPTILGLRLVISEHGAGGGDAVVHTRHIVVDRAPALFRLPCSEKDCVDGGHDLTSEIMRALRLHITAFDGRDVCYGTRYNTSCKRELTYNAIASYSPSEATPG